MRLCKLISYDLANGILRRWIAYIGVFLLGFVFCLEFHFSTEQLSEWIAGADGQTTMANYLIYLFAGKPPFTPDLLTSFIFPIVWMILLLYIIYLTLEYPMRNMTGHGVQVVVRTKSRAAWWLSKSLWVVASVLVCFFLLLLAAVMTCLIFGEPLSFISFSKQANEIMLNLQLAPSLSAYELLTITLVLPFITIVAIGLIQLCLTLFLKRIHCFLAMAVLLFASAYYQSSIAIGNFAMIHRSLFANPDGLRPAQGLLINGILIVFAVFIGLWQIRRHDILKKE